MDSKIFSEFEVKETAIKFKDDEKSDRIGCVGSCEETKNVKTITKKCEGVVKKQRTRGDGTASIKLSLHMCWEHYYRALGMKFEEFKEGVFAYGEDSKHEEVCITSKVFDEDGNLKLKAYPRFCITEAVATKIENGAEEVAEIEISGTALPDDNKKCTYEVMISTLEEEDLETFIDTFMTNFNAEMLKVTTA